MSSARQQQGFMIHGDKIVASPTHGGLVPTHGGPNPVHGSPNLDVGTPVNAILIGGQSLTTWARDTLDEIAVADQPNLSPSDVYIFNNATQTIVPLKLGPLAGGGNEQQPANSYLDATYQSGIGWLWGLIDEFRASGQISSGNPLYIMSHSIGGSMYVSTGAFGAAGNWTPSVVGGAYKNMKANATAFTTALAALGKTPNWLAFVTDLGISTAGDASFNTYSTDHPNMISNCRTDIIGASCPVLQLRISTKHQPGRANWATIRSAQEAMLSSTFKLINMDGIALEHNPNAADDDHPTAGSLEMYGREIAYKILNISSPLKELQVAGDAIYPLRYWQPASLETFKAGSFPWTDQPLHAVDRCGTADIVSTASGNAPVLQKTTLGNGLVRRALAWDGVDDIVRGGLPAAMNNAGGFVLWWAAKMTAGANKTLYAEQNTALVGGQAPCLLVRSDAGGNLCLTVRDDTGTIRLALASLGVVFADSNWHFGWVAYDGATTFTGGVDGTTGSTPQTYNKTTMTLNHASWGADFLTSVIGGAAPLTKSAGCVAQYNAAALAAYLANKRAYCQREFGTP